LIINILQRWYIACFQNNIILQSLKIQVQANTPMN
jgi:hypothetical protein